MSYQTRNPPGGRLNTDWKHTVHWQTKQFVQYTVQYTQLDKLYNVSPENLIFLNNKHRIKNNYIVQYTCKAIQNQHVSIQKDQDVSEFIDGDMLDS